MKLFIENKFQKNSHFQRRNMEYQNLETFPPLSNAMCTPTNICAFFEPKAYFHINSFDYQMMFNVDMSLSKT